MSTTTLARLRENLLDLDLQIAVEDDWDRLLDLLPACGGGRSQRSDTANCGR